MDQFQKPASEPQTPPFAGHGLGKLTLQGVMDRVAVSTEITQDRRGEIMSALRTAARCIGSDPGDILAQPVSLRKKLKDAPYLLHRVSKRRWAAVRSLTLTALRLAGFAMMSGRRVHLELTPAWAAMMLLAPSRHNGIGMSRLMSFCSKQGVEPFAVDLGTFLSFRDELDNNSLLKDAGYIYRTSCTLWNRASQSIAAWPRLEVPVPNASKRYSLDWEVFPASFLADVEAFLIHTGSQNELDDDYAPSVRPATTRGRRQMIRVMATALDASGIPAAQITTLATLVQADNARKILTFFMERHTAGKEYVYAMAVLLRTLARHWVPRDEVNIAKLEKYCRGLTPKKNGMTAKNRALLRQFDDPRNLDALLGLPAKLMRLTKTTDTGGQQELQTIIQAVAIEILTVVPIRIKNLTLLDITRHIVQSRRGSQVIIHLVIPGEEVKNGQPVEMILPKASAELLSLYLTKYRPRISAVPSPWLFPNAAGGPRNVVSFGRQISLTIKRHTGLTVHVHLFRHLGVKLILEVHPDGIVSASQMLGHKSLRTTQRAYSEGKTAAAHKRFEAIIDAKRDEARGRPSLRRGKGTA